MTAASLDKQIIGGTPRESRRRCYRRPSNPLTHMNESFRTACAVVRVSNAQRLFTRSKSSEPGRIENASILPNHLFSSGRMVVFQTESSDVVLDMFLHHGTSSLPPSNEEMRQPQHLMSVNGARRGTIHPSYCSSEGVTIAPVWNSNMESKVPNNHFLVARLDVADASNVNTSFKLEILADGETPHLIVEGRKNGDMVYSRPL